MCAFLCPALIVLAKNSALFLVSSVRHWTHLESILPSRKGRIEIDVP